MGTKKIEILNGVVTEFGLTPEQVIENWAVEGKISADFLNLVANKVKQPSNVNFKQPEIILPGMFYYAKENLISPDIIDGLRLSGVVGYVDDSKKHGLIIGLYDTELPWSSDFFGIGNFGVTDSGREVTKWILAAAQEQGRKAEAVQWCANYAFDGISEGSGFLPSKDEWQKVAKNIRNVNLSLERVNARILKGYYWSSSECSANGGVWFVKLSDGKAFRNGKTNIFNVRCAFAF